MLNALTSEQRQGPQVLRAEDPHPQEEAGQDFTKGRGTIDRGREKIGGLRDDGCMYSKGRSRES